MKTSQGSQRVEVKSLLGNDAFPLVNLEDAPVWLKPNKYIKTGYRVYYTWSKCFRSVVRHHNETGNIWTHLIAAIGFLTLAFWFFLRVTFANLMDAAVFGGFFLGSLGCFFGSTLYHTIKCHSPTTFTKASTLDYCGVGYMVTGSFVPPIYFMFYCMPHLRAIYCIQIIVFGLIMAIIPWTSAFHQHKWYYPRLALYVISVGSGLFPFTHGFLTFPTNQVTLPLYIGWGLMLSFYGVGVAIYALRLPERFFPGEFDYWFHSHQIWHCFVVAAAIVHYFTSYAIYKQYRHDICGL